MLYYDILFDNPSGLWPLDLSTGTVFSDMSGYDLDAISSDLLNLYTNPSLETATGTTLVRQNVFMNSGFQHATGTTVTRRNLMSNPVVENNAGYWRDWAGTSGVVTSGQQTGQTGWAFGISKSFRATWTTASTTVSGGIYFGPPASGTEFISITEGKTYGGVVEVRCSKVQRVVPGIVWYDAAGVAVGTGTYGIQTVLAANTPTALYVQGAVAPVGVGAVKAAFTIYSAAGTSGTVWNIGDWIEGTNAHFEETTVALVLPGYANGNPMIGGVYGFMSAATYGADYTYTWAGTVHASVSEQRAPAPTSISTYGTPVPVRMQSSETYLFGTKSMKILWDTGTSYSQAVGQSIGGLTVGRTYRFSVYVLVPTGSSNVSAWNSSVAGTIYDPVPATGMMSTKDEWVRISATWVATATSHSVGVITNGSTTTKGQSICYVDGAMLEESDAYLPYFEGGFPRQVNRSNLCENPVALNNINGYWMDQGTGGVAGLARVVPSNYPSNIPASAARITWTTGTSAVGGGIGYGGASGINRFRVSGGSRYSIRVIARANKSQRLYVGIDWYNSAGIYLSSATSAQQVVAATTPVEFSIANALAPTSAATGAVWTRAIAGTSASNWAAADWLEMSGIVIEEAAVASAYFDGDSARGSGLYPYRWAGTVHNSVSEEYSPDFTYAWTGTVDNSLSNQLAPALSPAIGNINSIDFRSNERARFGSYSMKVLWATRATSGGRVDMGVTLEIGKTYTVSIYVYVPTGSPGVAVGSGVEGSYGTATTTKDTWTRITHSFVATATSNTISIRCASATIQGDDVCFADGAMVEEGSVASPYTDGNSPNAMWAGIPHQSTTLSPDVEFVEPVAAQGGSSVRIQGDHTLTFPLSGALQQGKETKPFTLEFWMKNENATGTFNFGPNGLGLSFSGSTAVWNLGGTNSVTVLNAIQVGVPQHIVATYDTSVMQLYIDGALAGSTLVSNPTFTGMTQGTMVAAVTGGRVVALDQVATYNYTLSGEKILDHYRKGTDFLSIANNDAGLDSIRVEFDDLHLPVVYRSFDEYGSVMDGLVIRDNKIQQQYDALSELYIGGTYTHLVQFDDQVYGTAKPARIDWNVIGDATQVTVESSKDNAAWATVTNHGMTTNWDDLMDGNDYFLRVTVQDTPEPVIVEGLTVTMYSAYIYTSSDTEVKATVVNNSNVVTGLFQTRAGAFINRDGVKLNAGSKGIKVDTHTAFGNVGTIEMLLKPFTGQGTYIANGASRLYRDATGLHWTGFDRIVVNGVDAVDGDDSTVGWKHVVAVFTTANNNLNYIGAKSDGTDESNPQLAYLALHRKKFATGDAKKLFDTYMGNPPVRITDANIINVGEHLQDNGDFYKVYAFDWSVSGAMGT